MYDINDIELEEENPRYKKKKKKNVPKKSDHKHEYEDFILKKLRNDSQIKKSDFLYSGAKRCKYCGKYEITWTLLTKKIGNRYRLLSNEDEIREYFKDIPILTMEDLESIQNNMSIKDFNKDE